MVFIKRISAWLIGLSMILCLSQTVLAQDADNPTSSTQAQTSQPSEVPSLADVPEMVMEKATEIVTGENPKSDLDAAFEALNAAERDFLEASKERYTQEKSEEVVDVPAEIATTDTPKKSLIPTNPEDIKAIAQAVLDKVLGWLTSPPFLAQVGAIFLAWVLSLILAKQVNAKVFLFRDEPKETDKLRLLRQYIYRSRNFLRAAILVVLLAIFAAALKAVPALGDDWLVKLAQGIAVVFLLYKVIQTFLINPLYQKLANWTLIPLALLMVLGYFDDLLAVLDSLALGSGENPISLLTLIKVAIFGGVFFWLGNFSNEKGQTAIRSQENMDSGIREIISKFLQIAIFGIAAIMAMSAAGIGLGGLVVIISALSLGVGLGLQPIAANFVSGLIILFDRTVRIGDFVVLPDGQEGFVEAINMRSTTVETTDGKDIMVPNTTFIENSYENWTHKDPRQRYEVYFQVEYGTDIETLEDIIIPVFEANESVLSDPEEPDLELREFGERGIKFAVEFWCSGIDDGPNKFTSDLNFEVWRALKKAGIKMPLPQREVRILK